MRKKLEHKRFIYFFWFSYLLSGGISPDISFFLRQINSVCVIRGSRATQTNLSSLKLLYSRPRWAAGIAAIEINQLFQPSQFEMVALAH